MRTSRGREPRSSERRADGEARHRRGLRGVGGLLQVQRLAGNRAATSLVRRGRAGGATGAAARPATDVPLVVLRQKEYTHVVIDKQESGVDALRHAINRHGLRTAEQLGIELSEGSRKLDHHRHVFLWDDTEKGASGVAGLVGGAGATVSVRVRMPGLKEPGWLPFSGNLKADSMGRLGGSERTGAWAFEGAIPRRYVFIDGMDSTTHPGYDRWLAYEGWPADHADTAERRYGYEELP